jgi:hypothetical protein
MGVYNYEQKFKILASMLISNISKHSNISKCLKLNLIFFYKICIQIFPNSINEKEIDP